MSLSRCAAGALPTELPAATPPAVGLEVDASDQKLELVLNRKHRRVVQLCDIHQMSDGRLHFIPVDLLLARRRLRNNDRLQSGLNHIAHRFCFLHVALQVGHLVAQAVRLARSRDVAGCSHLLATNGVLLKLPQTWRGRAYSVIHALIL